MEFLKELVIRRFPDEPAKHGVGTHGKGVKIACPYCGDSQKDPSKKRGLLYYKTKTFKCNNDGCDMFATMRVFVAKWAEELDIDITNYDFDFTPEVEVRHVKFEIGSNTLADHLRNGGFLASLLPMSYFVERFGLMPVSEAREGSTVRDFLQKRRLYDSPVANECVMFDQFDNKVIIFNHDKISGKVLGYAIRYIGESRRGLKYDLYNSTRIREQMRIEGEVPDIEALDTMANYFNIMNVDFRKPVTLLEGQFDSMLIKNAVAVSGVNKLDFLLTYVKKANTRILLDNDKAGRREAFNTLRKSYPTFLWGRFIHSLRKKLPNDIQKISEIKDINDLYCFLGSRCDLTFDNFNDMIDRHYSDSPYDIIFL